LGWPDAFVTAVTAHHKGRGGRAATSRTCASARRIGLVHRETRWPALSVSSDRIAIPAMRAAAVLSALAARGTPVGRAGPRSDRGGVPGCGAAPLGAVGLRLQEEEGAGGAV
jgi:hypothetical protein